MNINFKVFDEDPGSDDLIGEAIITVAELVGGLAQKELNLTFK